MTKIELLKAIVNKVNGATQKDVEIILDAYSEVVFETLNADKTEKIPVFGIGTFKAKHVNERSGKAALADNKEWKVPEHDEICFKINKSIKTLA